MIAFETALCDSRVAGLVLINGQGYLFYAQQKAKSNLRTQVDLRYYLWRALRSETWLRVFSLKLDYWGFVRTVMHRLGSAFETSNAADPEVARIRNGFDWLQRVAVLMVYAASDPGILEVELLLSAPLRQACQRRGFEPLIVEHADHLFTLLEHQAVLLQAVLCWIKAHAAVENSSRYD